MCFKCLVFTLPDGVRNEKDGREGSCRGGRSSEEIEGSGDGMFSLSISLYSMSPVSENVMVILQIYLNEEFDCQGPQ